MDKKQKKPNERTQRPKTYSQCHISIGLGTCVSFLFHSSDSARSLCRFSSSSHFRLLLPATSNDVFLFLPPSSSIFILFFHLAVVVAFGSVFYTFYFVASLPWSGSLLLKFYVSKSAFTLCKHRVRRPTHNLHTDTHTFDRSVCVCVSCVFSSLRRSCHTILGSFAWRRRRSSAVRACVLCVLCIGRRMYLSMSVFTSNSNCVSTAVICFDWCISVQRAHALRMIYECVLYSESDLPLAHSHTSRHGSISSENRKNKRIFMCFSISSRLMAQSTVNRCVSLVAAPQPRQFFIFLSIPKRKKHKPSRKKAEWIRRIPDECQICKFLPTKGDGWKMRYVYAVRATCVCVCHKHPKLYTFVWKEWVRIPNSCAKCIACGVSCVKFHLIEFRLWLRVTEISMNREFWRLFDFIFYSRVQMCIVWRETRSATNWLTRVSRRCRECWQNILGTNEINLIYTWASFEVKTGVACVSNWYTQFISTRRNLCHTGRPRESDMWARVCGFFAPIDATNIKIQCIEDAGGKWNEQQPGCTQDINSICCYDETE